MSSHNHPEDLLDLSLKHALKNWGARKNAPADARDQLLAAAAQQSFSTPKKSISRFHLGWSIFIQSDLSEAAVRSLYGYALEAMSFRTSMATAIR